MSNKAVKHNNAELKQAQVAAAEAHKRWAAQRLSILDKRLGSGIGASRERMRLIKILGLEPKE